MGISTVHHTIRRVLNRFKWKDDVDLDTDGGGKRKGLVVGSQSLASGVAYCISSCSMILLNKLVLSGFRWEAQISLMLYQVLPEIIRVKIIAVMVKQVACKMQGICPIRFNRVVLQVSTE